MWLAEKIRSTGSTGAADVGIISVGGASPTVMSEYERGSCALLSPAGLIRLPADGEEHLTMECADGTRAVLGTFVSDVPQGLQEGEIYAATDSARIWIKNDGSIELSGDVNIVGSLTVNGVEF